MKVIEKAPPSQSRAEAAETMVATTRRRIGRTTPTSDLPASLDMAEFVAALGIGRTFQNVGLVKGATVRDSVLLEGVVVRSGATVSTVSKRTGLGFWLSGTSASPSGGTFVAQSLPPVDAPSAELLAWVALAAYLVVAGRDAPLRVRLALWPLARKEARLSSEIIEEPLPVDEALPGAVSGPRAGYREWMPEDNGYERELAEYETQLAQYLQEKIKPGLSSSTIPLVARSLAKEIARREPPESPEGEGVADGERQDGDRQLTFDYLAGETGSFSWGATYDLREGLA